MKRTEQDRTLFERVCVDLIFFLLAFLMLFLGIRAARETISFAQAEKIEIINNVVEGLGETSAIKNQGKKLQNIVYKYGEAFLKAVAGFEFVPRNDFTVLPRIINAMPAGTEILNFTYQGRNLTITTTQPDPRNVVIMAENLKRKHGSQQDMEDIVYSYYIDRQGNCIAQITIVVHHYDENDLEKELEKQFLPSLNNEKKEE